MNERCKHKRSGTRLKQTSKKKCFQLNKIQGGKRIFLNQIALNNWPYFESRCNPLTSKDIKGTDTVYDEYSDFNLSF